MTGVDATQATPLTAAQPPFSLFKRDVSLLIRVRSVERDAGRPQKGDTHPVSTQQPLYVNHITLMCSTPPKQNSMTMLTHRCKPLLAKA